MKGNEGLFALILKNLSCFLTPQKVSVFLAFSVEKPKGFSTEKPKKHWHFGMSKKIYILMFIITSNLCSEIFSEKSANSINLSSDAQKFQAHQSRVLKTSEKFMGYNFDWWLSFFHLIQLNNFACKNLESLKFSGLIIISTMSNIWWNARVITQGRKSHWV